MLSTGMHNLPISDSFSSAILAPAQKIKPKIIATWLDSRHLENLVVTTNDAYSADNQLYPNRGFYFPASECMNGIERQSFTWAVAGAKDINGDIIKADGSWYAMPSLITNDLANTQTGSNLEFGWWSNSKSNAGVHISYNGYGFSTDPYVEASFTTRKVNKIKIVTSEFYGQIYDYTLQVYDGSAVLVLTEEGTMTSGSYYQEHFVSEALSTQNVSKIKVTVRSTKNPEDYARIQEIVPMYQTDISDSVISYSVNRSRDVHSTSLPIGGSEIGSVEITIDNTSKDFNLFNSNSLYGQYMVKNVKMEVYTGWRIKKPQISQINDSYLTTQLLSNTSASSSTFTVIDGSMLKTGGASDKFLVTIDEGTQSEEIIACTSTSSSNVVTVYERGYGGTIAKAHSANATVKFDIYEYVKNGTFYVDQWGVNTDMSVKASLQDWTKFISERIINYGFLMQNVYVGDAVKNLLMRANFPKADFESLHSYVNGAKNRGAIAVYSFNEESIDRSGNNIVSSTGLRARFWGMPISKKNIYVKDILADAIDKELSPLDKAMGEKKFVSPSYVTLSKSISDLSTDALKITDYSFVGVDNETYIDYFNGVFDGYYVPTESGLQQLILWVKSGGVALYIDDKLILDRWNTVNAFTRYASSSINFTAGVPRKIRIEFFHEYNDGATSTFKLHLYKAMDGLSDEIVSASECCTIAALDSMGCKDPSSTLAVADSFNHRNTGIYIGSPKLNQDTGLVSDPNNKSVLLDSSAYIRIPYSTSIDLSNTSSPLYTGSWSIEFFAKFTSGSFSGDGEYISNWGNSVPTSGFEFFNNASSHGFKIKTSAGTSTVSSSSVLSNSYFYHFAVTFENLILKYYVNGVSVNEATIATPLSWVTQNITIGGRGSSYSSGAEVAPSLIRSFTIDEAAFYNRALSSAEVADRYTESAMQPLTEFAFLYGNESSIREVVNDITFADLGRSYINENDKAKYEHYYRFFEGSITQHASVQTTLSDSTNIIDANYSVDLQCNKVTIPIASLQTATSNLQTLWVAAENETLGTTGLSANITSSSNIIYVDSTINPVFAETGYLRIGSEIIEYISKTATSFNGLVRGKFQTIAASHAIGLGNDSKVREARYYDIKFDKSPAYNVKSPLISAIRFEEPDMVDIVRYMPYAYGAELIVSASNNTEIGGVVFLQGTNPLTDLPYFTGIAGTAVQLSEQNIQIKEQSSALDLSIKKYGLKDLKIESKFISSAVHAKKLAEFIISKTQIPVPIIDINVTTMPFIQLGDRIRVSNLSSLDIVNTDYWVISHQMSIGANITQGLTLRQVS